MSSFDRLNKIYSHAYTDEERAATYLWYHLRRYQNTKTAHVKTIQRYFSRADRKVPSEAFIRSALNDPRQFPPGTIPDTFGFNFQSGWHDKNFGSCFEDAQMSTSIHQTKFEKASHLVNLLVAHATGNPADSSEYEALRHELLTDSEVTSLIPAFVRTNRNLSSFWGFIKGKFGTYTERQTYLSQEFTPLLDLLEFGTPSAGTTSTTATMTNSTMAVARNKRKVFIVHGRENEAKQEVARFIESIGLQAIILHEQASTGMTIIEKIETYSGDADFALVLYTPCDLGQGVHETKVQAKRRARQNVVFEHGYLMAKLGRENVCALVKGEIETPNDISGVVYVDFDAQGTWKTEVAKELKACGYEIKS